MRLRKRSRGRLFPPHPGRGQGRAAAGYGQAASPPAPPPRGASCQRGQMWTQQLDGRRGGEGRKEEARLPPLSRGAAGCDRGPRRRVPGRRRRAPVPSPLTLLRIWPEVDTFRMSFWGPSCSPSLSDDSSAAAAAAAGCWGCCWDCCWIPAPLIPASAPAIFPDSCRERAHEPGSARAAAAAPLPGEEGGGGRGRVGKGAARGGGTEARKSRALVGPIAWPPSSAAPSDGPARRQPFPARNGQGRAGPAPEPSSPRGAPSAAKDGAGGRRELRGRAGGIPGDAEGRGTGPSPQPRVGTVRGAQPSGLAWGWGTCAGAEGRCAAVLRASGTEKQESSVPNGMHRLETGRGCSPTSV